MRQSMAIAAWVVLAAGAQQDQPSLAPPRPVISIKMEQATVAEVLQQIGDLSGISIQYAEGLPEAATTDLLSVTFRNAAVRDVLGFVTRMSKLTYTVVDATTIRIEPAKSPGRDLDPSGTAWSPPSSR